jgi:hypothetical protein
MITTHHAVRRLRGHIVGDLPQLQRRAWKISERYMSSVGLQKSRDLLFLFSRRKPVWFRRL